jgi:hypothetical protein
MTWPGIANDATRVAPFASRSRLCDFCVFEREFWDVVDDDNMFVAGDASGFESKPIIVADDNRFVSHDWIGSVQGILGFESQQLSYRLPVKVVVLRANLIALNLNEGSPWIGDGATGRRGAVHERTGVGAV